MRPAREPAAARARGCPAERCAALYVLAIAYGNVFQVVVDRGPTTFVADLDHVRARPVDDAAARRADLAGLTRFRLEIQRAPRVLRPCRFRMRAASHAPGLTRGPGQAQACRAIAYGGQRDGCYDGASMQWRLNENRRHDGKAHGCQQSRRPKDASNPMLGHRVSSQVRSVTIVRSSARARRVTSING